MTAYSRLYKVTERCKEAKFVKDNIPEFRIEWARYCYFEHTEDIKITPHQQIIVKKKVQDYVCALTKVVQTHYMYVPLLI